MIDCPDCLGEGLVVIDVERVGYAPCPACGGDGCQACYDGTTPVPVREQDVDICPLCDGTGLVSGVQHGLPA